MESKYRNSIGGPFRTMLGASRNRLLWSSSINVIATNIFAIYYSLSLGPDRRSYLATVFAVSLILHTFMMYGPGLSFRRSQVNSEESVQSFTLLLLGSILSIPIFFMILFAYSIYKQPLPSSLYIAAALYYLGSICMFVTTELLFHHMRYQNLYFSDTISALALPVIFSILYFYSHLSLIVCVLLSFLISFMIVVSQNLRFNHKWALELGVAKHFLLNTSKALKSIQNRLFFRITIFNSLLERGDKVILAFLADSSLFAKFTFNIAPLLVIRFLPQLFTKLAIAKRSLNEQTRVFFTFFFSLYLAFSATLCLLIGWVMQSVQDGTWFIGFAPLIAFAIYESLRVTYSFRLAGDISGSRTRAHDQISKFGLILFPLIYFMSLIFFPNSITSFYLISSVCLLLVFVWKRSLEKTRI